MSEADRLAVESENRKKGEPVADCGQVDWSGGRGARRQLVRAIDWEVLRSNGAGEGCSHKEFKRALRNGTTKYWLDRTHRAMFTKFESQRAARRGLKRSKSGAYALKTLWERDPTTTARSVLSGGWRDKTDKTLPNETVATHWGNLLSRKGTADKRPVQHVDTLWCLTNPVTPDEVKAALVGVSGVSGPDGVT